MYWREFFRAIRSFFVAIFCLLVKQTEWADIDLYRFLFYSNYITVNKMCIMCISLYLFPTWHISIPCERLELCLPIERGRYCFLIARCTLNWHTRHLKIGIPDMKLNFDKSPEVSSRYRELFRSIKQKSQGRRREGRGTELPAHYFHHYHYNRRESSC